jgi:nucleoside-triphosphatase|tara:strand:- start:9367 stop:11055 length:1689 start_codon:yes stop_codon:yes gene_type:complete
MPPARVRHVFLTGFPGVGKTSTILTAIGKIQRRDVHGGFFTQEIRDSVTNTRVGFDVVTIPKGPSSVAGPLARLVSENNPGPKVGRYVVNLDSVERIACHALQRVLKKNSTPFYSDDAEKFVVIDEIGKMECFSARFIKTARQVLDHPHTAVLGSIPVGSRVPLANEVRGRSDALVLQVTLANRDALADALALAFAETPIQLDSLQSFLEQTHTHGITTEVALRDTRVTVMNPLSVTQERPPIAGCGPLLLGGAVFGNAETVFGKNALEKKNAQVGFEPGTDGTMTDGRAPPVQLPPRVLLLGEHGSPLPGDGKDAYAERSFWRVLDLVLEKFLLENNGERCGETARERCGDEDCLLIRGPQHSTFDSFGDSNERTGSSTVHRYGRLIHARIAVWDVLAGAHGTKRRGKNSITEFGEKEKSRDEKSRGDAHKNSFGAGNDILGLLRRETAIDRVVFIGEKAWRRFQKVNDGGVTWERTGEKVETSKIHEDAAKKRQSILPRERFIVVDDRRVHVFVVRSARGDATDLSGKVTEWRKALFWGEGEKCVKYVQKSGHPSERSYS